MPTLLKIAGVLLLIPAAVFLIALPFAFFDADPDGQGAIAGLIMLGAMFGIPGWLLFRGGAKRAEAAELETQMVGFVRSRDAFSIDELAAHIGKTPAEAQTLLHRDIARYHLPLVLHTQSGRYLRLDRLSRRVQVAERCQSCGGSLGSQVVFEGEHLTCPYCGAHVSTHAPGQVNWSGAQGAWAQQGWNTGAAYGHAPKPHYPQAQPHYPQGQHHGHGHAGHHHPHPHPQQHGHHHPGHQPQHGHHNQHWGPQ